MVNELKFLIFGDAGVNTPVKHKVCKIMNDNNFKNIILLGDNFYPYGIESEYDNRWKEEIEKYFKDIKIYPTLGNHCYLGNVQAQINYSKINTNWFLPNTYYDTKFYTNTNNNEYLHFISIDTFELAPNESINCSKEMGMNNDKLNNYVSKFNKNLQLNWLENTLKESTAKYKIVFGHYPIFSNGDHGNCQEIIDEVLPLLLKYNVTFYMSGHDHNISYSKYENLKIIVSGNGCKIGNSNINDSFINIGSNTGVFYLILKENELEFGFYNLNGEITYKEKI